MPKIKNAPLTRGKFGKTDSAAEPGDTLSITDSPSKSNIHAVSTLIDQALFLSEFHSEQSEYHADQARKHRRILAELQRLIPHKPLESFTEGDDHERQ